MSLTAREIIAAERDDKGACSTCGRHVADGVAHTVADCLAHLRWKLEIMWKALLAEEGKP